jgi:molecular chaperone DnaK
MGAAIQGGVLAGDVQDVVLLDVTPLNLGLETMGGVMTTLIDANTTIPTKRTEIFSTAVDNQPGVQINVLQGNRPMANQNKQIGLFHLDGIAPAPAHVPQIEVTFDIDSNGILSVSAIDKATGKEQNIRIEAKSGLSQEEIERMKREAEENAEADRKLREEVEKLNIADSFAFSIEKALGEAGDKVTEEEKTDITAKLEELRTVIKEKKMEDLERVQKELQDKWYPIATKLYQQTAPQEGGPQPDVQVNPEDVQFTDVQ